LSVLVKGTAVEGAVGLDKRGQPEKGKPLKMKARPVYTGAVLPPYW